MKHLYCIDKLPSFLAFLLHDLLLLCSFFVSHPLTLAYMLLLFPYLLKLLFLLYPLLFSTFLLLFALLTSTSSEFHVTTSSAILDFLRSKLVGDEGEVCLTEQLCAMVFVEPNDECSSCDQITQFVSFSQNCNLLEDFEGKEEDSNTKKHGRRPSEILRRDGSMRKEKEWKRTLACKLFEERMTYKLCEERKVVDGAEEMDLLWEAYEVDADKTEKQRKEKDAKKAVKEKVVEEEEEEEDDDEDDDKEKGMSGKLCCLQALKLSAGKMSLGVRRPSLVKVSMALKGMSVFHREGRRRRITI